MYIERKHNTETVQIYSTDNNNAKSYHQVLPTWRALVKWINCIFPYATDINTERLSRISVRVREYENQC